MVFYKEAAPDGAGCPCLWLDKRFGQEQTRNMKSAKGLHFLNRWFCISAAMLLASATLCEGFSGGLYPVFEMERCVGDAKLVVRGLLDENGNLQAQETLKGEPTTNQLSVVDGADRKSTRLNSS